MIDKRSERILIEVAMKEGDYVDFCRMLEREQEKAYEVRTRQDRHGRDVHTDPKAGAHGSRRSKGATKAKAQGAS